MIQLLVNLNGSKFEGLNVMTSVIEGSTMGLAELSRSHSCKLTQKKNKLLFLHLPVNL